ncbi:beta-galactosidase [Herbiconiux moechotypicola]|uniref:Beta-galactosidase n=1 Tax=Herbiconiux moechotypicola TaxID=637393 RepID=A0ABN3DLV3_9MICO|nr:beta-galactosidase [Herbiconiux moechotypicola]MCS5730177.1 beta-galactosidase [Herbiconiux moechotypicola]
MPRTPVSRLLDADAPRITFGADYNPEQWTPETWADDVRLMREARVNLVAINIFGWAQLEPLPGQYDFSRLDAVIELLHENGIAVDLGTGTASPPPWLTAEHPEALPVTADGTRRAFGGRQGFCPSSPVYREHALALVEQVARRYGTHPAVKLWHVSNEIGCHNAHCYCEVSAAAFRRWLEKRYGTLDALNEAWGTAFWSQRYAAWEHIQTPALTLATGNPAQAIDFRRFSSAELLEHYVAERDLIRTHSSVPVTTNFMVTAHIQALDYWTWAPEMDLVANDHYLDHRLPHPTAELAFAADATRGLAQGEPYLLMEQASSAVNWQPRNIAKGPGEMLRNTLTHVARGADGISFFQWRASVQGSERFHSAMLPHGGTDTRVWRDVVDLGGMLERLAEVTGTRVVAEVALVFGWEAWWITDLDSHPTAELRYLEQVHRAYEALRASGVTVDVVAPGAPLDDYRLVVVPALHSVSDTVAERLERFVAEGGHAVITFFSGVTDEVDRVRTGGYPGAFRELLGVSTEEFFPLHAGETVRLDDGSTADIWTERLHPRGAEVLASYLDGPLPGTPAVTRNAFGDGTAWYLATNLDSAALTRTLREATARAGVALNPALFDTELEVVRRSGPQGDYLFVINHGATDARHAARGYDLIEQAEVDGVLEIAAGGVRVVRLEPEAAHTSASAPRPDETNETKVTS